MKVQRLVPPTMMKPLGSYCQSTRRGNIVATAGVAAVDREGKVVGGNDIVAQTRATLDKLETCIGSRRRLGFRTCSRSRCS